VDISNIKKLGISALGPAEKTSPLGLDRCFFIEEEDQVLLASTLKDLQQCPEGIPRSFELAGPRRNIYFNPAEIRCGIVSCGGLCPGMNDVIRSLVMMLYYGYGVQQIIGFRYGFQGLSKVGVKLAVELSPQTVKYIHEDGGTYLGSSRGPQDAEEMVDTLQELGIKILFVIGGDGTMKGATKIHAEVREKGLDIGVICIPKTIDNDLEYVTRSFGFTTAVEEARKAISGAHVEALGALNGVGLVKLMGRHSGFIAAHAALASGNVNFCLVPEHPIRLSGKGGLLEELVLRLKEKHHAVIVVAEGAGQDFLVDDEPNKQDASGNLRLKNIGLFLQEKILDYCADRELEVTLKYIDPSYIIRSLPATAYDSSFCMVLGHQAAHAGMAGKTGLMIGHWNNHFIHVPLSMVTGRRRQLDDATWQRVLETTGQKHSITKNSTC